VVIGAGLCEILPDFGGTDSGDVDYQYLLVASMDNVEALMRV